MSFEVPTRLPLKVNAVSVLHSLSENSFVHLEGPQWHM